MKDNCTPVVNPNKYDFSYESLRYEVNWYCQLKDAELAAEFAEHNQKQRSHGYLLYFLLIYTILTPVIIFVLIKDFMNWSTNAKMVPLSVIHAVSALIAISFGWKLFLRQRQLAKAETETAPKNKSSSNNTSQTFTTSNSVASIATTKEIPENSWFSRVIGFWTENCSCKFVNPIFMITSQLILTCIFIRRSFSGNCGESSFGAFICQDPSDDPEHFLGTAVMIIVSPVLAFTSIPDTPIEVVWINLFLNFLLFVITAVLKGVERTLIIGVILFLSTLFAVVDVQIRNILLFLTNRKLKEILEENERMADAMHAEEMRHMIGNVAHDLKTVSCTSFYFTMY